MTQGAYQVIQILPIKSKMAAAKKRCLSCDFCIKLSLHLRHSKSRGLQMTVNLALV